MLGEGGVAPNQGLARLFGALSQYEPGPDLRQDLQHLAQVRHRLDLLMAEMAGALASSQIWEEEGYVSPIQWLREEANLPTGVACQHVGVGLSLDLMPGSVEALERGEIGFGHLALMADAASFYKDGRFKEAPFLEKARQQKREPVSQDLRTRPPRSRPNGLCRSRAPGPRGPLPQAEPAGGRRPGVALAGRQNQGRTLEGNPAVTAEMVFRSRSAT